VLDDPQLQAQLWSSRPAFQTLRTAVHASLSHDRLSSTDSDAASVATPSSSGPLPPHSPVEARLQVSFPHHSVTPPASVSVSSTLFAQPLRTHVLTRTCSTSFAKLFLILLLSLSPPWHIYLEEIACLLRVDDLALSSPPSSTGDCFHSLGQVPISLLQLATPAVPPTSILNLSPLRSSQVPAYSTTFLCRQRHQQRHG
jgi:hypothetical protein